MVHLLDTMGKIGYLSIGEIIEGKTIYDKEEIIAGSLGGLEIEEKKLQTLSGFINSEEPRENVGEVERKNVLRVGKWFYDKVTNNGDWDYKKKIPYGEHVGNFNYGLTGRAILRSWNREVAETILLRFAGLKQIQNGTSLEEWGSPIDLTLTESSYGDDPRDQKMIKKGIEYYDKHYSNRLLD